ncbi:hypothetical protein SK128_019647, partial [Halocaridina rubra]
MSQPFLTHEDMGPPSSEITISSTSLNRKRSLTAEERIAEPAADGPYFVVPRTTDVTVRTGQAASFTCIVKQLGDKQVSWIRGRDLHVLSSGQIAFSSDSRVSVAHVNDAWTLNILYTQPRDAGRYSCQVNTQPRIATWYNLTVI